jgi:hypothetical protein
MNANHSVLLAVLTRRPFVSFTLRIPITDPAEISIDSECNRITVSFPLETCAIECVQRKPETQLIAEEQQGLKPALRVVDPADPADRKHLDTDPSLAGLRANFAQFRQELDFATKYGFSRLELTKCPEATSFAQAIALGWFNEIRIGRKNRSPIQDIPQLIAVLEKLQYPYLAQGVVTKKGAEQLAAEWDTARRERNKTRMHKARDRNNRHKIVMRKSRAGKKSEYLPKSGDQDPEPLNS